MVAWEVGISDTLLFFLRFFKAISGEFLGSTFFSLFGKGAKFVNVLLGLDIFRLKGVGRVYVLGNLNVMNLSLKNSEMHNCSYFIES